ncbi:glycosyltransferase family 4 protein [Aeromonas veronii]|uniref:glycosyltransferase family 4 protein n=1 Tax=Aeromonas veronii TaxID=654 RepID=UPI0021D8BC17|nr:glycosyltransferase family 4 protein [Aeromonas veronii]UYB70912.1 glycosyltransferase family 4 protein [Aeromonas veronii]
MKQIRVTVLGTRGIPHVLGGVETHCQFLYPELHRQFEVAATVLARAPYVDYRRGEFEGVALKALPAPKKKSLEAILHSLLAAFYCRRHACDLVHVHAIGPGLVVPLLRLLGKRVVFTHHGPDYDRQKWGALAKWVLRLGERWAVRYASEVIVISEVINEAIRRQYDRQDAHLIYNGVKRVALPAADKRDQTLARFGLSAGNYLVAVGRFVEEKGLHDLIAAYRQLDTEMPLVLVGDTDHPTPYSEHLQRIADETPGVIRTGFLNGEALISVFSQAALFAMPSYHEGLPIALLEALSFSLPVVVSDIPANLAVALQQECYFPVGDVSALAERLNAQLTRGKVDYSDYLQRYDWQRIAGQTMAVYRKALGIPAGENQ